MRKSTILYTILFLLSFIVSLFLYPGVVHAQTENAYDLIGTVNGLRASMGLEAYQIDSYLMSYAQQHAEYMASIQSASHRNPQTFPNTIPIRFTYPDGDTFASSNFR